MTHTVTYPDCPSCGNEMKFCKRIMPNEAMKFLWICNHCGAESPDENSREAAYKTAMAWSTTLRSMEG